MNRIAALLLVAPLSLLFPVAGRADDVPRPEHPRPDFRRDDWKNLNGEWSFRFDPDDRGVKDEWFKPGNGTAKPVEFDRKITVPFCWESELSGVHDTSGQKIGWYRRTIRVPNDAGWKSKHVWLCFGAVDWRADVWVNGKRVGRHEGGYTPFEFDITEHAAPGSDATIVVRAFDPADPSLPNGKQVGWYTTTSGIWQTVWLEARPWHQFSSLHVVPIAKGEGWTVKIAGRIRAGYPCRVVINAPDAGIREFGFELNPERKTYRTFVREFDIELPKLWTPEAPHLYDLRLQLIGPNGQTDELHTYFGLRTIARGRFGNLPHEVVLLNVKPIYLRGALDQSFNPKGIYTAPSDEFLRNDIELAKSLGLNFLRIHIKSEEPRRLYWADRLGMLIMQDMPNTWQQNELARKAWEQTARETIIRDRYHPSIFAWVDFNETWGLGHPEPYKADKDTQQWVKSMVAMTRQLDPTRLVEDNSPCYYDHVSVTDLNSWHFYIDDYDAARRHIEDVVVRSTPGSSFNHCPGEAMNSAPLINSEYGSVSAGSGDRDVSWGFRYLTTQLRRHEKIQGYIYTELSDIEWEHNGFVNYDRSPKEFGYDAFVPGMTVADLQGADFVGFDAPPAITATVGDTVMVPVFVSHFSERTAPPKLRFWLTGTDELGGKVESSPAVTDAKWQPFRVTMQEPVRVTLPKSRPMSGAICFELVDDSGKRLAANYVNVVSRRAVANESKRAAGSDLPSSPRVEVLGPRKLAVRFRPDDFASQSGDSLGDASFGGHGKAFFFGDGSLEYRLKLPAFVWDAGPTDFELVAEIAAKAADEKLDWPSRRNAQDYPQTDVHKHPSRVAVTFDGRPAATLQIPDDPADGRGVLSHLARFHHGSYGYLKRISIKAPPGFANEGSRKATIPLSFTVSAEPAGSPTRPGGFTLFGETTGQFVNDPTLIISTARDLKQPEGWTSDEPVAVDRLVQRFHWQVPTGEQGGHDWRFTTDSPPTDWQKPAFDDANWRQRKSGFGTDGTPGVRISTRWNTSDIWLRATVECPSLADLPVVLRFYHDEDIEIFANGQRLLSRRGYVTSYQQIALSREQRSLFREGTNTIAVHCRQTGGGQGVDVGLGWIGK